MMGVPPGVGAVEDDVILVDAALLLVVVLVDVLILAKPCPLLLEVVE